MLLKRDSDSDIVVVVDDEELLEDKGQSRSLELAWML